MNSETCATPELDDDSVIGFALSLRFGYPSPAYRYELQGPVYFGLFPDVDEAKATLREIIGAVHDMPEVEVTGVPRFTGGNYEVADEMSEVLTVVEQRRGIVPLTAKTLLDLQTRMSIIIPLNEWAEHLPRIRRYLMERVNREYEKLYGPLSGK